MAYQNRPAARRLPSQAWNRLKPSVNDPLESVGLPSKGETRLNDLKSQESYYAKITDRYMKFCADAKSSDELERQFAAVSISSNNGKGQPGDAKTAPVSSAGVGVGELSILLSAMRKLREAIVATGRTDMFAQQAYTFIIRAAILAKAMESYHPALLYLLQRIHPYTPLPPAELHEFVGYRILDLACRQQDFVAAYALRSQYEYRDRKVENVLHALVHDNWVTFWKTRRVVDGHQRRLMEWHEGRLRLHALKCVGKSYFTAEKNYVERCADLAWPELVKSCQLGWELDGEKVTIRKPKAR